MDSKCFQRVMKTGRISEYGNAAQQTIGHKECQQSKPGSSFANPWINQKYIHGDAAELEWKIPPDITAAADGKSKGKLFPYLAAEHKHTAYKEKDVGFIRKR